MDIASLSAISGIQHVTHYTDNSMQTEKSKNTGMASFESLLNSAMNLVKQTEDYSNAAEVEEVKYAMGESDSLHDLMVAQHKANVSLQYTVAVKNTIVEAITSEEYAAAAKRPAYSILENYMLKMTTDFMFADWHDAIAAYIGKI